MKNILITTSFATGVIPGYSGHAWTQTASKLPMPGYNAAKDFVTARVSLYDLLVT